MDHQHTTPAHGTQTYTCPMHPKVVKPAPGNCFKCRMKLVPVVQKETTNSLTN